ncbi:MAG: YeeE/YedE family protein [Alphaproteobacteria bacterium]
MTSVTAHTPATAPRMDAAVVGIALAALIGGTIALDATYEWRHAAQYAIGGLMGLALYHAAFGFASGWRALLTDARGRGLRMQLLMIGLATLVFLPALDQGSLFGYGVGGAVAPAGVSVLVGAFLFGIGMQLGGGCASGTLYTAGGGNTRMVVTLVAFISGSLVGTLHMPWWVDTPTLRTASLVNELGLMPALALQIAVLGGIALLTVWWERRRHGHLDPTPSTDPRGPRRFLHGPWPLVWGALALAALNIATLAVAGHPWSITFGFALWGAKIAALLGIDVASWTFWTWPFPANALADNVFADGTSVMNFGILLGAALAAGLAGKMAPTRRIAPRPLLLFSGIASASPHGWLWFAAAMIGTFLGARLRPFFLLDPATRP